MVRVVDFLHSNPFKCLWFLLYTVYFFCVPGMKWELPIDFGFLAVKSELVMIQ